MEIPIPSAGACLRCGDLPDGHNSDLCRVCRLVPPPFERTVFFGLYQGRMRQAIHALKYDRIPPIAAPLGHMLALAIAQLRHEAPGELLILPIPLHRRRHAQRGFNQTRLLARQAITVLRRTHPDWQLTLAPRLLLRIRNTESQAHLTPRQRRQNTRGAFRVSAPATVAGKHILLVDDILTTGATARAAALALRRAGAASVRVATLARARREEPATRTANAFSYASTPITGPHDEPLQAADMLLSTSLSAK